MDERFHFLVSYLIALANYAKDFHYYCKSFGVHLFCDEVYDGLYEFTDTIRENIMLGSGVLPHSSQGYLLAAAPMVMPITDNEAANFEMLMGLLEWGKLTVNDIKGTSRGQNALLDEVASHIDKMIGLTFLQMRKYGEVAVQESKNFTKEECKGCIERAVDRAKAELAKINYEKVAATVAGYSNQQAAMCEDDTLDKLSKKLGV